jgi:hypothetical protein
MSNSKASSMRGIIRRLATFALVGLMLFAPLLAFAGKKKKADAQQKTTPVLDYSNIVWPNPPAIARIRYQAFYAAQKLSQVDTAPNKKQKWMDRLAGTQPIGDNGKVLYQLAEP